MQHYADRDPAPENHIIATSPPIPDWLSPASDFINDTDKAIKLVFNHALTRPLGLDFIREGGTISKRQSKTGQSQRFSGPGSTLLKHVDVSAGAPDVIVSGLPDPEQDPEIMQIAQTAVAGQQPMPPERVERRTNALITSIARQGDGPDEMQLGHLVGDTLIMGSNFTDPADGAKKSVMYPTDDSLIVTVRKRRSVGATVLLKPMDQPASLPFKRRADIDQVVSYPLPPTGSAGQEDVPASFDLEDLENWTRTPSRTYSSYKTPSHFRVELHVDGVTGPMSSSMTNAQSIELRAAVRPSSAGIFAMSAALFGTAFSNQNVSDDITATNDFYSLIGAGIAPVGGSATIDISNGVMPGQPVPLTQTWDNSLFTSTYLNITTSVNAQAVPPVQVGQVQYGVGEAENLFLRARMACMLANNRSATINVCYTLNDATSGGTGAFCIFDPIRFDSARILIAQRANGQAYPTWLPPMILPHELAHFLFLLDNYPNGGLDNILTDVTGSNPKTISREEWKLFFQHVTVTLGRPWN